MLTACVFVTRDTVCHVLCSENLFVNRIVHDQRRSWTEVWLYLVTVLLISPSKKKFLFPQCTLLWLSVGSNWDPHFYSCFRLILSLTSCRPYVQLVQWYHLHVLLCLFFAPLSRYLFTISPTSTVILMYSLHRLNRPGVKIQPCFARFYIGKHSVVP
jgi:hypothetical protein